VGAALLASFGDASNEEFGEKPDGPTAVAPAGALTMLAPPGIPALLIITRLEA
jgi:hypothetical protein